MRFISKNISWDEAVKSKTAEKHDIENIPNENQIQEMKKLAKNIFEPLRKWAGHPIRVNSFFRSPELCLAIGSSLTSQHSLGQAADFEIFGVSNQELAHWIDKNLDYDQLILEFWKPEEKNSGWIHCSFKNKDDNRKEFLRAYRDDNGKTKYEKYSYRVHAKPKDALE